MSGERHLYQSETSQRDINFLNESDLNNVKVPHHDKSFNEQLDDKGKFVINSNEHRINHNMSIGAIS